MGQGVIKYGTKQGKREFGEQSVIFCGSCHICIIFFDQYFAPVWGIWGGFGHFPGDRQILGRRKSAVLGVV